MAGRDEFPAILEAIRATSALDETRGYATREAALAREALRGLPPSNFKDALLELCAFAVARSY